MRFIRKIFGLIAILTIAYTSVFTQDSNDTFASGGGFKLDLPKTSTLSKDISFKESKFSGEGKVYTWEKPQAYFYQILYYKLTPNSRTLTIADKNLVTDTFKNIFLKESKERNIPFMEKPYFFNGNKGTEIQVITTEAKLIARLFVVGQRFYFINITFKRNQDEAQILRTIDSFSLLDSKSLVAAKIKEATPKPLPQEPVAPKPKTDAQDNNLRGKVKSVIEDTQVSPKGKRERSSEQYYEERGNLVKEISFLEGCPSDVTIWGFIDGNRVNNSGYIYFDDDQRPPTRNEIIQSIDESPISNSPIDTRYSGKYIYKYNEKGQLIEKQIFSNDGQLLLRNVYNYKGNQREELNYGRDGSQWSQTVEILDKDGNVLERNLIDADGKVGDKIIHAHEFDGQGNWIIQKAVEKKVVKRNPVIKPLWVSYRTITYYP